MMNSNNRTLCPKDRIPKQVGDRPFTLKPPAGLIKQWIDSLTETLPMTALDYTAPQGYIPLILGFKHTNTASDHQAAIEFLKGRLNHVLTKYPFLSGVFINGSEAHHPRVIYSTDPRRSILAVLASDVFTVQIWDDNTFPYTYQDLTTRNGLPVAMDKSTLCLLPSVEGPDVAVPPATLKINFIPGGLLLGLSLHHGLLDGGSVVSFLAAFTSPAPASPGSSLHLTSLKIFKISAAQKISATLPSLPTALSLPEYAALPDPPVPGPQAPGTAKIFTLSSSLVNNLHPMGRAHVRNLHGDSAFISVSDHLQALTWVHTIRVRLALGKVHRSETTTFATAVDIRRKMGLDNAYMGNMFMRVLAQTTVDQLVGATSVSPPYDKAAEAAWLIRQAITTLDANDMLERHVSVAAASVDPDQKWKPPTVDRAVRHAVDRGRTGVDASVWTTLGGDMDFGIPGVQGDGKPDFVRKCWSPFPGAMNILPRKGVTRGEADWELLLALSVDEMERICDKGELGGYCSVAPF
ncbi:hypothetical protein OQA88_3127 [Cercophora sp. LCS_1]